MTAHREPKSSGTLFAFIITGVISAIAVIFIGWSVSLIISVNSVLDEVAENVRFSEKLRGIVALMNELREELSAVSHTDDLAHIDLEDFTHRYAGLRADAALYTLPARACATDLAQLDSLTADPNNATIQMPGAAREISDRMKNGIEIAQRASSAIRTRQATLSGRLRGYWDELTWLAVAGGIMALIAAIMAIVYLVGNKRLRTAQVALRVARDEAATAARVKSDFLANISHEIRTPLNGIIGITDLLLDGELSDEQRDFVRTTRTSGEHLLTLINNILDFSRIESGKLEFEEYEVDIRVLVDDVVSLVASIAQAKRIELLSFVDVDIPSLVITDGTKLRQILLNLVGNAIKFTLEGEIIIGASLLETQKGSTTLQFTVEDTGIGIPPGRIDKIFEEFTQADPSTNRKFGGTGLGLTISSRLAQAMGGAMRVESVEGQGSTFYCTVQVGNADEVADSYIVAGEHISDLQDKGALLVSANGSKMRILQRMVGQWKMRAYPVRTMREALALLNSAGPIDVCIIDAPETGIDWYGLEERFKTVPKGQSLPLVLLASARQIEADKERIAMHFTERIAKPIRQRSLLQSVWQAVCRIQPDNDVQSSMPFASPPQNPPILVVDDNAVNRTVLIRQLRRLGYAPDVAGSGTEAIEMIRHKEYVIIFMDVQMPIMDGLEATRQILSEASQEPKPVIIALTANTADEDRKKCMDAGMSYFLSKPVSNSALKNTIERYSSFTTLAER